LSLLNELKRRNVFKVAIAYAVTTWILLQLTDLLSQILDLPEWAPKLILLMLVIGFVPALIIAWAFELTPEGIKLEKDVPRAQSVTRKTGRKLNYVIIVSLGLSLGFFVWESRFKQRTEEAELAKQAAPTEEPVVEAAEPEIDLAALDIDKNSIAVLPFANRSADDSDIYFTDGIHDDLLTQLSKIDAFSVISRTSVMEYRDTAKNLKQIARELNVANIMEGSVQRSGDRVRINVQLIDAATDEHLWAEIYDRELTTNNLFDIQSEIAKAIASALKAKLTDSELASVSDVPTDNVAAYDIYLQARRIAQNSTSNDLQTAVDLYKEALALDPGFKYAWTGLANTYISRYWVSGGDPANRDLALDAIEHARGIDDDFAELYTVEGFYWYWGFLDYERALYKLDKAIEMMPGNDQAWMGRGYISRRSGLWEQAVESIERALRLNPRVHLNWVEYAYTLQYLHRFEEADSAIARSREIDPDNFWGKTAEALLALQARGDVQTAVQLTIGAQRGDVYDFLEAYMVVSFLGHRYEEALEVARGLPVEMEIQRQLITLKEDWAAQTLHFMGKAEEAGQAAAAALFRLKGLRAELGDDYRLDLAEARIRALQGGGPDEIRALVQNSQASAPADELAAFERRLAYAQIYGIAGMAPDAIEMLEPLFQPPSETSVYTVDLDPSFDTIREDPAFVAIMDRNR
jgi:TolB-like protein